jgi:ubiquitin-conjugating enzyme E2 variant
MTKTISTTEEIVQNRNSNTDTSLYQQRKANATVLAQHYTKSKRAGEIFFISLFVIFLVLTFVNVWPHVRFDNVWVIVGACVLSMMLADSFSGLLHWGVDTWGSFDTPLIGKSFIRSFREHHVDPFRITVHDVVETNGDNCMAVVPALAILSFAPIRSANDGDLFILCFMVFLCIWVAGTNQIHKWAHTIKPSKWISILQDAKIILSRKNHQVHHHNPFDRYYCITTGWLNPVLGSVAFWKRMELLITNYTGSVPRQDDAIWTLQNQQQSQPLHTSTEAKQD